MKTKTSKLIGRLALEAMLVEVSVTPKPGLVDRRNSGAHSDMGFFTFMSSAAGLRGAFDAFAEAGIKAGQNGIAPANMLPKLRVIGVGAERDMFAATGGVNTHKGEIFSLGLLSACAGYLDGIGAAISEDVILTLASQVCKGLCDWDFRYVRQKANPTKGEMVYMRYGLSGIRGEAEAGYPTIRFYGLPALRKYLADGRSMNDALAFTLLYIMAMNYDTNIIARHDMRTQGEVFNAVRKVIATGPKLLEIRRLDKIFIARNISPSGSADLLAATYFLHSLTQSIPN